MDNVWIIIPAYNEQKSIGTVLRALRAGRYKNVVVIDDGSSDRTSSIARQFGAVVMRHPINRGLGGALGTGIAGALELGAEYIVTFDADGQHDVRDIELLLKPLRQKNADVAIGTRLRNPKGMPLIRRIGNWGFNIITYTLFGVWTTDSQSGLRALSRKAAEKIEIRTNRMEVSSEIIKEIGRNKLHFVEVPIKVIYTDYSIAHGQSSWNGIRILFKLFLQKVMK